MNNLSVFAFDGDRIRQSEDGYYSIFDIIRILGGQKGERKVWERLQKPYPEVVAKCHNFKFPGRGQRETPVTNKEGALYIIGLLPGAVGRKYREEAAKLFLAYLDDPAKLGRIAVDRASTPEQVKQIESAARRKYLRFCARGTDCQGSRYRHRVVRARSFAGGSEVGIGETRRQWLERLLQYMQRSSNGIESLSGEVAFVESIELGSPISVSADRPSALFFVPQKAPRMHVVSQGKQDGYQYLWTCPHPKTPCPWCYGGDLESVVRSLSTSRGQTYYGNLKYYLSQKGQQVAEDALTIIRSSGRFSPANLLELVEKHGLPRSRTKIIAEWLEDCRILPSGTYEKLRGRGFNPTKAEC